MGLSIDIIRNMQEQTIEQAQTALNAFKKISTHPDVNSFTVDEVGILLAQVDAGLTALDRLKASDIGLSIEEIQAAQAELERAKGQGLDFETVERIINQQKALAVLKVLSFESVTKFLEGTRVNFVLPPSIAVGKYVQQLGYITSHSSTWSLNKLREANDLSIYVPKPPIKKLGGLYIERVNPVHICRLNFPERHRSKDNWVNHVFHESYLPRAASLTTAISERFDVDIDLKFVGGG